MQRCLAEGHKPVEQAGAGPYAGQSFLVCSECGKVLASSHPPSDYGRSPGMEALPYLRAEQSKDKEDIARGDWEGLARRHAARAEWQRKIRDEREG